MQQEVIDESRGPGRPVRDENLVRGLEEIWRELGHHDGRFPTLDEALQEIRALRRQVIDIDPEPVDSDVEYAVSEESRYVNLSSDGLSISGYPADEVLTILRAYRESGL